MLCMYVLLNTSLKLFLMIFYHLLIGIYYHLLINFLTLNAYFENILSYDEESLVNEDSLDEIIVSKLVEDILL